MPQVTIGDTAYRIGATDQPYALQNNGTTDIYLGTGPDVTPAQYDRLLDVGGDLSWPAGQQLFCIVDKNLTGQLTYINNGAQGASGATRISGPVNVTGNVDVGGPVTIAGTVPVSGNVGISGPVAISGTVPVSGNMNITGGTVDISGPVTVGGNVAVNNSVAIKKTVTPLIITSIPTNVTTILWEQPVDDYDMLYLSWQGQGAATSNLFNISIVWYTSSGQPIQFHNMQFKDYYASCTGSGHIIFPALAGVCKIAINNVSSNGEIQQFQLLASTSSAGTEEFRHVPGSTGRVVNGLTLAIDDSEKATFIDVTTQYANSATYYYLPTRAGKARVYIVTAGSLINGFELKPLSGDYFLYYTASIPAGNQEIEIQVNFPPCPVRMAFSGTATDSNIRMSIVWE